ncbi:hypothetical protein BASA60_002610 [Batrachochytrium salamandrivorans]|nr:hypothetical protein BASA60_002610 [Batrachochytrium salamandrivorans]
MAPFLHKRTNDGKRGTREQPNQKSLCSNPDFSQKSRMLYVKDAFKDDPNSDPNPSDDTKDGPIDFPEYVPDQDDEAKDERENVYAGLDPGQGRRALPMLLETLPLKSLVISRRNCLVQN